MNTAEIRAALRRRYCAPEWALMFEVSNSTGAGANRSADAVAMNLWPSRGLAVHGFEIKVSRGDWQRELANPAKAEAIQRYCDHWWIVTAPNVIRAGELPPTWGHLELQGARFSVSREAPRLEAYALDRGFVWAMLRRACEADQAEINALVEKQIADLRAHDERRIEGEIARRTRRSGEITARVDEIKAATGIDLTHWIPTDDVARVIKAVIGSGLADKYSGLPSLVKEMEQMSAKLRMLSDAVAPDQQEAA